MVWRVEARCADVAPRTRKLAVILGAERIAVVLDEPKVVLLAEGLHGLDVERIAERVREHHGLRLLRPGPFKLQRIDICRAELHIHKHGHGTVLHDRRDRGGEARRDRNHLIAAFHLSLAEKRRSQRHEGEQVCRRPRIDEHRESYAQVFGKSLLELSRPMAISEPKFQRGIDEIQHLTLVKHATRIVHARLTGDKRFLLLRLMDKPIVFRRLFKDLFSQFFRRHVSHVLSRAVCGDLFLRRKFRIHTTRNRTIPPHRLLDSLGKSPPGLPAEDTAGLGNT